MEVTLNITKRIEWLKRRMTISPHEEDLIRFQLTDLAIECFEMVNDAGTVSSVTVKTDTSD